MAMYRYNNQPLPEYPSGWNKSTHPYGLVIHMVGSDAVPTFRLVVSSHAFSYVEVQEESTRVIATPAGASIQNWVCFGESDSWIDLGAGDYPTDGEWCYFDPTQWEWVWCYLSIYDDNFNVVFQGSTPILIEEEPEPEPEPEPDPEPEEFDLRSFLTGLAMSLCTLSRGTFPQRNPVAFLYNGVRLPGLPVVEKPYALIRESHTDGGVMWAYFKATPFVCGVFSGIGQKYRRIVVQDADVYILANGEWVYREDHSNTSITLDRWEADTGNVVSVSNTVHWCKPSILYEDETVFLGESDPVPVYE